MMFLEPSLVFLLCSSPLWLATEGKHTDVGLDDMWDSYKAKFLKTYEDLEEPYRRKVWENNVQFIQRHNLEYDLGLHTYTVGLNEYADLTPQEYRKYLLGFRPESQNFHKTRNPKYFSYDEEEMLLPDNVDWRQHGYVTPVKNQGQCGSCWAFSSTGSLEGQHFRQTGRLVSLSEQNLVDCDTTNAGCNGGWMMNAFDYVRSNSGIDKEDSYPYEARDDTCRYTTSTRGAEDTGYVMIPYGDEQSLKAAVGRIGPVAVAIDATHQSFQLYRSGVYVEPACSNSTTDHAVLAVGYGVFNGAAGSYGKENGQDYWLVKNSWGTSWGMEGYIMMARNLENQCAIASYACFPIV